jgi:hypothetical protein
LARKSKREAAGSREGLSNVTGIFVNLDVHARAGKVNVGRHALSLAPIENA